jgi:hypothetical protein
MWFWVVADGAFYGVVLTNERGVCLTRTVGILSKLYAPARWCPSQQLKHAATLDGIVVMQE